MKNTPDDMQTYINEGKFNKAQLEELQRGLDLDLPVHLYANPTYTAAEMANFRNLLETSVAYQANPKEHYMVTDYGPEEADFGFKSYSNFAHYPDRVCYVPENWDFEEDGPGYTAKDILDLCGGDQDKAEIVFDLCEWEHPSTVLDQWDSDDDLALLEVKERKLQQLQKEIDGLRTELAREGLLPQEKPSLLQQISSAEEKKAAPTISKAPVTPEHSR